MQGEQRQVVEGVKQATPLATTQLRGRVRDVRRRARMMPEAAKRIVMIRDVAIFCAVFHTMKRDFELSVAAASQVLPMTGGEGL